MGDTEAMDVDPVAFHDYSVWMFPGLTPASGMLRLRQVDYRSLTVSNLKQLIVEEDKTSPMRLEPTLHSPDDFDLLYKGNLLQNDNEPVRLNPDAIVYVVKKTPTAGAEASTVAPNEPAVIPASTIKELSLALRDSFMSTNFIKVIEELKESSTLNKILAVAPGLETDLIGIAIIQSPQLMFQISDREMLQRVATNRPWLVEALKLIVATVRAERNFKPVRLPAGGLGLASELLNTAFLDGAGGEEDEDDMEDDEHEPSRAQSQPNLHGPITREQLARALSALPVAPMHPLGNTGGSLNALGLPGSSRPTTAPPSSSSGTWNPADNFQQLLQNAFGANPPRSSSSGQNVPTGAEEFGSNSQGVAAPGITAELLARAVQTALNQLPPSERANELERFRQMAQQVISGNTPPGSNSNVSVSSVAATSETATGRSEEFRQQLNQMREIGITDERLSILALRVSEGDVATAVELIYSGWDGSGAE